MVATFLVVLALLGMIGTCVKAYDLSADARHRDQARALLQSLASQFQCLIMVDSATNTPFPFFETTTAPTGVGLSWTGGTLTADGLQVHLGGDPTSLPATITREVSEVNETTGVLNTDTSKTVAGKVLVGTFRVNYMLKGQPKTESITIARTTK